MKCALVVLFCVVLDNCRKDTVVYSTELFAFKYPTPLKATITRTQNKVPMLQITWNSVKNWEENDPIIGYKLVLWEMKKIKRNVHSIVNGEMKIEEVIDDSSPRVPVGDPMIFTVTANNRNVTIENVKEGTWYEYAAFAFTQKGQGPLSPIVGVKIHGKDST